MLKLEGINAGYGDVQILWNINLDIRAGSITALIGANGVGKTTLIRTIAGAIAPKSGKIVFDGSDITRVGQPRRAEMGIMMVPEGRQLYSGMSVEDNLLMGAYPRRDKPAIKRDLEWVYSILPVLKNRRKQLAGTMSGGEAQMCAIGRGLMADPKLLLLDELSLGLAPVIVDSLVSILKEIHQSKKITILLVDQDVQVALGIAEKGHVIVHGKVEISGDSAALLGNPDIQKAYLGL